MEGRVMEEKNREDYITMHFSQIHNIDKIEKEYANYYKFLWAIIMGSLPKTARQEYWIWDADWEKQ